MGWTWAESVPCRNYKLLQPTATSALLACSPPSAVLPSSVSPLPTLVTLLHRSLGALHHHQHWTPHSARLRVHMGCSTPPCPDPADEIQPQRRPCRDSRACAGDRLWSYLSLTESHRPAEKRWRCDVSKHSYTAVIFPMSADTIHNTDTAGSELTVRQLMLMTSNVSVVLVGDSSAHQWLHTQACGSRVVVRWSHSTCTHAGTEDARGAACGAAWLGP